MEESEIHFLRHGRDSRAAVAGPVEGDDPIMFGKIMSYGVKIPAIARIGMQQHYRVTTAAILIVHYARGQVDFRQGAPLQKSGDPNSSPIPTLLWTQSYLKGYIAL